MSPQLRRTRRGCAPLGVATTVVEWSEGEAAAHAGGRPGKCAVLTVASEYRDRTGELSGNRAADPNTPPRQPAF